MKSKQTTNKKRNDENQSPGDIKGISGGIFKGVSKEISGMKWVNVKTDKWVFQIECPTVLA